MDSTRNIVSYCCVSKGGRVLYTYISGGVEVENLAAYCLETIPPYHHWYFQTMGQNTFGFLMGEDEYVYFVIVNEKLGSSGALKFLQKLRDEFIKIGRKGSTSTRSVLSLDEQLLPVVHRLVASLEHVSGTMRTEWRPAENSSPYQGELTPSPCSNNANEHFENGASTKAPLLGKPGKQEKKKMKDHVVSVRDTGMKEHRRSTDGGMEIDSDNNQGKNFKPASSQNMRAKWCHQVRIVLAIDAAICIVLFIIWLVICRGTECIR